MPLAPLSSCYVPSTSPHVPLPRNKTPRSVTFGDDWSDYKGRDKPLAEVKSYDVTPEWWWRAAHKRTQRPALDFGEYSEEWVHARSCSPGLGQVEDPDRFLPEGEFWTTEEVLEWLAEASAGCGLTVSPTVPRANDGLVRQLWLTQPRLDTAFSQKPFPMISRPFRPAAVPSLADLRHIRR